MAKTKLGLCVASLVTTFGFSGLAHADFVNTVSSEGQCITQDGSVMDLNGTKHCLVAVIPPEFQESEYAGELKGVTQCPEKSIRKTSIGDFCLIALEPIKQKPVSTPIADSVDEGTEGSASVMREDPTKMANKKNK